MLRTSLLAVAVGFFLVIGSTAAVTDKKDTAKPKEEEKFFNKTIGEWIKVLRTDEKAKSRQRALIALEYANAAGTTALPAVIAAVEVDKEPAVRHDAVMLLGRLGPKTNGALKAIAGALQTDKDDSVREAAATAMGTKEFLTPAADYITVLIGGLKDPHAGTRIAVAGALRNMGKSAEPAFPALFDAAKNPKEHFLVREAAVHALSRHAKENPKTVPVLVEVLKESATPATLRQAAAEGLGRTGSDAPEVVMLLSAGLTDKDLEMRKSSAVALGSLGAKAIAGWPIVKDRLKYTLAKDETYEAAETDSSVRNQLIRLCGALGKTKDEPIRVLIDAAKFDKSTENRIAAIQELSELGARAKSAIPELVRIADDDARSSIREAADKAAKHIKLQ